MNRKQQPQQERYCEEDWNNISAIDTEAYWVSKVSSGSSQQGTVVPGAICMSVWDSCCVEQAHWRQPAPSCFLVADVLTALHLFPG